MYLSYFNPIGLRNKTCTVVLPSDSCHFLYPNMLDIQVRTNLELHLTVCLNLHLRELESFDCLHD